MKWNEISPQIDGFINYVETDVECPKCGKPLRKRIDVVLTSYPAQYYYYCPECGFEGVNF